jgi:hypothetical protein
VPEPSAAAAPPPPVTALKALVEFVEGTAALPTLGAEAPPPFRNFVTIAISLLHGPACAGTAAHAKAAEINKVAIFMIFLHCRGMACSCAESE